MQKPDRDGQMIDVGCPVHCGVINGRLLQIFLVGEGSVGLSTARRGDRRGVGESRSKPHERLLARYGRLVTEDERKSSELDAE